MAYHELDRNGVILRVNRVACALFGYQPGEMLGQSALRFVAEVDRAAGRQAFHRKLSGEQPLKPVEIRIVRRDGGESSLESHDILVRNAAGETIGIRTALLDITARKRAEAFRDMDREILQILNEPGDLQGFHPARPRRIEDADRVRCRGHSPARRG